MDTEFPLLRKNANVAASFSAVSTSAVSTESQPPPSVDGSTSIDIPKIELTPVFINERSSCSGILFLFFSKRLTEWLGNEIGGNVVCIGGAENGPTFILSESGDLDRDKE